MKDYKSTYGWWTDSLVRARVRLGNCPYKKKFLTCIKRSNIERKIDRKRGNVSMDAKSESIFIFMFAGVPTIHAG